MLACPPRLLGGALCLDFVNTVDYRVPRRPRGRDLLSSYAALADWGRHAGILTGEQERALRDQADRRPDAAAETFAFAIELRETLYRIFDSLLRGDSIAETDLEVINIALSDAVKHSRLISSNGTFAWVLHEHGGHLERVVWPIALSAMELLTSKQIQRLRSCPQDEGCGWLFLDFSKNGSRRWCSMDLCGSHAKARRQYARTKNNLMH